MKYAFIVLIAIYLVTYGCSTDESEKAGSSHEPTATAALENPPQGEMAAEPADQHEPAPATEVQQHQTAAAEPAADAQEADSEQVVMPCGRTMAKGAIPENAPCLETEDQGMINTPDDQELSVAMQRMVETTNGVIVASRQLVTATYLMLNASEEAAEEADEQAAEQSAVDQEAEVAPEQEVVETMQQFISAAREVIDATNQAIYSVLQEKQQ
jgi:hypothetical protein